MALPIDLEQIRRVDTRQPRRDRRAPLPPRGTRFVKGPIPLSWMCAAAKLPGSCCQVAVALWYVAGLTKSGTVKLSSETLRQFGVDRWAYNRALRLLELARLVTAERSRGKSAVVTLLQYGEAP